MLGDISIIHWVGVSTYVVSGRGSALGDLDKRGSGKPSRGDAGSHAERRVVCTPTESDAPAERSSTTNHDGPTLDARQHLNAAGVEHDAARAADRLRREVSAELCADRARGAVTAHHLAPNASELGALLERVRLVDVRHALPEVKIDRFHVIASLQFEKVGRIVRIAVTALVTKHNALHVQTHGVLAFDRHRPKSTPGEILAKAVEILANFKMGVSWVLDIRIPRIFVGCAIPLGRINGRRPSKAC